MTTLIANSLKIFIPGKPEPQGSVKGFPIRRKTGAMGVAMTCDNVKLKGWRGRAVAIIQKSSEGAFCGAVCVSAEFIMPRPAGAAKTARGKALGWHVTKPDTDKLQRAVGDALTASGIITDDSQIAHWCAMKRYAGIGEDPGTLIEVTRL